jgi:hypothetical protein
VQHGLVKAVFYFRENAPHICLGQWADSKVKVELKSGQKLTAFTLLAGEDQGEAL